MDPPPGGPDWWEWNPPKGVPLGGNDYAFRGSRLLGRNTLSNCCANSAGARAGNGELLRQFGITQNAGPNDELGIPGNSPEDRASYWAHPQFRYLMDLTSQSQVLKGSAQQLLSGKTPKEVYAGIQRTAQLYGANNLDQAPSLANLKCMRQMMDQYGFKADTNMGFPIDSPFNPNNPNSVFNKSNPESRFYNGKPLDQNSGGCDASLHPSSQTIQDLARYGRKPSGYAAEGGSGFDTAGNPLGIYAGPACR